MYFDLNNQEDKSAVVSTILIGSISLLAMIFLSFKSVIPGIEKDLLQGVSQQLLEHKIRNVLVSVEGRDIYLEGVVNSESADNAISLARRVKGVRRVYSNLRVIE
ncbi:MAG: BON domain-containing protein [Gammaproteobacteria bacterium]|nr:BON domain-containing protein [Gammaproteobacteria bacterium]NNM13550.1 BON domain-containing protein [Gammaproteobacteria bacterium]